MSKLLPPKLRFGLYIIDTKNLQNKNYNNGMQYVMCYADSYEIQDSGAITFYQALGEGDKKFKVPVLTYPSGKWDACVLLDDQNEFPAFKGYSTVSVNNSNQEQEPSEDYKKDRHQGNYNQSHQASLNQPQQHGGSNLPGVNQMLSPQEFKKQKEEWLETEIKNFAKDTEIFNVEAFLNSISKTQQNRTYKAMDSDVEWAASKLIRNKVIMSRKFAIPHVQKVLSLILPDIMRRQWDGKMAPILQILLEKEETKNVTAIDLAVWMVQNNY